MPDPVSHDPQSLYNPISIPTSLTTFYTAPSAAGSRGVRLVSIIIVNRTTTATTFQLTHTENGGGASAAKAIVWDMNIPGDGVPHEFLVGAILNLGDFLSHRASVVDRLVNHGYGWEMTD